MIENLINDVMLYLDRKGRKLKKIFKYHPILVILAEIGFLRIVNDVIERFG